MGESRWPWRGCRAAVASICKPRSGDAFKRNHESEELLTAICVCVRALPLKVLARRARQFRQLQFHCGNPPPAAEPRISMRTIYILQRGAGVGIDLAVQADLFKLRLRTFHKLTP